MQAKLLKESKNVDKDTPQTNNSFQQISHQYCEEKERENTVNVRNNCFPRTKIASMLYTTCFTINPMSKKK
ncbi:hypothetical protein BGS_0688 [Beggiatoa sp. SS]|nr:hypothetical protein BGS_0688 [Beggiatoa sp. SS]